MVSIVLYFYQRRAKIVEKLFAQGKGGKTKAANLDSAELGNTVRSTRSWGIAVVRRSLEMRRKLVERRSQNIEAHSREA